ncbi:MAG: N-acetylglucosamine-6-phosphate deacetylase, partial [Clostridia bacterium]
QHARLITPERILRGAHRVEDGRSAHRVGEDAQPGSDEETYDAQGAYVMPGLIDLHTHGGAGSDFMDGTAEDVRNAAGFHARHGVTSLVATSAAASMAHTERFLACIAPLTNTVQKGCRILGAHLEGPYLSVRNRGAHPEPFLMTPARDGWDFIRPYVSIIRSMTLAPELPGMLEMIRFLAHHDILVSGGHDDGADDAIYPAIDAGMRHTTHILCAMSTVCKRNGLRHTGLSEIAMIDDRLTTEIIADNMHIIPDLARLVYRCKGASGMCIVSDTLRPAGMPKDDTRYTVGPRDAEGSQEVLVDDLVAVLPDRSRFAGSIQTLDRMIGNLVRDCGIPLVDAVRMATTTPARIIGVSDRLGSLTPGKWADLCVMDESLRVVDVFSEGKRLAN